MGPAADVSKATSSSTTNAPPAHTALSLMASNAREACLALSAQTLTHIIMATHVYACPDIGSSLGVVSHAHPPMNGQGCAASLKRD